MCHVSEEVSKRAVAALKQVLHLQPDMFLAVASCLAMLPNLLPHHKVQYTRACGANAVCFVLMVWQEEAAALCLDGLDVLSNDDDIPVAIRALTEVTTKGAQPHRPAAAW